VFLINLCPYPVKNNWILYSWIGPIAVKVLGPDLVCLLGRPEQLVPPSQQRHDAWVGIMGEPCDDAAFAATERLTVPTELVRAGYDECRSGLEMLRIVADRGFQAYRDWLAPRLAELHARRPIEAAITHFNDRVLEDCCAQLGIPVIHHEGGNARPPFFSVSTLFFDFSGVNGRTEAAQRFAAAVPQLAGPSRSYTLAALQARFLSEPAQALIRTGARDTGYEIGLALQVEDDSNLVAYSQGVDSLELIYRALHLFPPHLVLIREHPKSRFQYRAAELGVRDESGTQFEFLGKVKRLMTVNSSVALEGLMLGLPTYVLGESPLGFMALGTPERRLRLPAQDAERLRLAMNFYLLGYLMPKELWLDIDYMRFRLGRPSEFDILRRHAAIWGLPPLGES
jgi:hypothetical protein